MLRALMPQMTKIAPLAGVGFGLMAWRAFSTPPPPEMFRQNEHVAKAYPALANAIAKLGALDDPQGLERIVALVVAIHDEDVAKHPSAQWRISRLSAEILREAKGMLKRYPGISSDDHFRIAIACEQDTIPQIDQWLENVLHNHLLSMNSS